MLRKYFIILWIVVECFGLVSPTNNLYDILGVPSSACQRTIRQAYRNKVKEFHPDKNSEKGAAEQFIKINHAYEILSDERKKKIYDKYGTYDDNNGPSKHNEGSWFDSHGRGDNFAQFLRHFHGFQSDDLYGFEFNTNYGSSFFERHKLTNKMYDEAILKNSHTTPFIIFIYANLCVQCMRAERIWKSVVEDLEPIGYGVGTVNAGMERQLTDRLLVRHLPAVVVLLDGRAHHFDAAAYRGVLDVRSLINFARDVLPSSLIDGQDGDGTLARDNDRRRICRNAISRNKVCIMIIGVKNRPKLRYLVAAFRFRSFADFGYVQWLSDDDVWHTKYGLNFGQDYLLIFDEHEQYPRTKMLTTDASFDNLVTFIDENKFLRLPRLSSPRHFDELCPVSSRYRSKSTPICILLLTAKRGDAAEVVTEFRRFAFNFTKSQPSLSIFRPRFVYVDDGSQSRFVSSLLTSGVDASLPPSRVAFIKRKSEDRLAVRFARTLWQAEDVEDWDVKAQQLQEEVIHLLRTESQIVSSWVEVSVASLIDENGPGIYKRLASRLVRSVESTWHQLNTHDFWPVASVLGTMLTIVMVGYCLNYAAESERKAEHDRRYRQDKGKPVEKTQEFKNLVRELRAETYFGLVRLLRPGSRTLVLICDQSSKDVLLAKFGRAIWPWRKNQTLMFAYLMVEKNLDWYDQLLRHLPGGTDDSSVSSAFMKSRKINPRNVIGTVLSINGFRQYFCIYHPKHAPSLLGYRDKKSRNSGDFLGFEGDSDSQDSESDGDSRLSKSAQRVLNKKTLSVDELLDGLPNWLDRLFEGSVPRYCVPEWPKEMR